MNFLFPHTSYTSHPSFKFVFFLWNDGNFTIRWRSLPAQWNWLCVEVSALFPHFPLLEQDHKSCIGVTINFQLSVILLFLAKTVAENKTCKWSSPERMCHKPQNSVAAYGRCPTTVHNILHISWRYWSNSKHMKRCHCPYRYHRNICVIEESIALLGRIQERELQMEQLSATRCSCIAILWVTLASFAAVILYIASQRVIPKVRVYFVIDFVRKLLDITS
jgi:hypothetical protein